jgi:predicted RNase H-like nuclease (RuvC/YqgF family)
MSLKLELDSRPTQEDYDEKLQQCNGLRHELSNLSDQMTSNEKLLESMQSELAECRIAAMAKSLEEREVQTEEEIACTKQEVPEAEASPVLSEMPQTSTANDDDDALNNHPKVLYEDELIVFKEKCTNLTTENVRLQREIGELRANMSHFHDSWLHNFMLKYLVPVLICFVAYIFYLLK